jgi:hypothetical protein
VAGSFVMYSKSKNKDCAGALMKSMATVENGTKWMEQVSLQTGVCTENLNSDVVMVKPAEDRV